MGFSAPSGWPGLVLKKYAGCARVNVSVFIIDDLDLECDGSKYKIGTNGRKNIAHCALYKITFMVNKVECIIL